MSQSFLRFPEGHDEHEPDKMISYLAFFLYCNLCPCGSRSKPGDGSRYSRLLRQTMELENVILISVSSSGPVDGIIGLGASDPRRDPTGYIHSGNDQIYRRGTQADVKRRKQAGL